MTNDMRDVILDQANQITHSLEVNKDVSIAGNFDSIILAGMGGSGHPGDLLNALGVSKLPLYVHRNYDLPVEYLAHMGLTKPLLITSSYSGNTEEPLTAYQLAKEKEIPIMASAAGGQLKDWAKRDNTPLCLIDFAGMQPRHTLFAAFTGIYAALRNSGLAENIDDDLKRVAGVIKQVTPDLAEPAKALASQLKGTTPVYNSSDSLGFAAKNFKIQTNENAKAPAFWNTFPDLNHNELVGFSKLADINKDGGNNFHVVILRNEDDHPRVKTRMGVTAELYEKWGTQVTQFDVLGDTLLEKLFYAVTFGMWTTYYLAQEYNIDPVPVDGVEDFKAKLTELAGTAT